MRRMMGREATVFPESDSPTNPNVSFSKRWKELPSTALTLLGVKTGDQVSACRSFVISASGALGDPRRPAIHPPGG